MINVDENHTLGDLWRVFWYVCTRLFYMFVGGVIVLIFYPIDGQRIEESDISISVQCTYPLSSGLILPITGV